MISLALAVGLAFPVLGWFGFETGGGPDQSATALTSLAVIYSLMPVGLKLGAIALMWNFPLDASEQGALRRTIEAPARG